MKIIGFEEHYGLPAIYEAAKKANDPYLEVLEALKKAGHFPDSDDPKIGYPPGIYDLGDGRIAAMDDAGIDVQILSYATPSAERLEPSVSRGLTRQANDTLAAAISKHSDRFLGFATLPMTRSRGCSPRARANRPRPRLRGRNDQWPRQRTIP